MNRMINKICYISALVLLLNACIPESKHQNKTIDEINNHYTKDTEYIETQHPTESEKDTNMSRNDFVYRQNKGYKLFYGTWKYVEVVSQHIRLGGDEGYMDLLGEIVTYHPDYFENSLGKIYDPMYLLSIYPINQDHYNQFFLDQVGIETLLPDENYFTLVQIAYKANTKIGNNGFTFFIDDDTTMYAFDNNCIYKLTRISYINGYDPNERATYKE
ncbi:MAG: hypothetical protein LBQ71_14545 [Hungatella sp.]|nr:hypothetical protein [Hungatella sp.]